MHLTQAGPDPNIQNQFNPGWALPEYSKMNLTQAGPDPNIQK
jgi:hypothetical protein